MSSRRLNAFSLVELLVVIAIVAVLFAMVLPSLSQAKEASYKVMCQSNLRQSGFAIANYAGSYKSHIPSNAHNADASDTRGPLKQVLDITVRAWESTNALRTDRNYDDLYSYSGMGLLMATDFIPYNQAGLRTFWCPAERKYGFNTSTSGVGSGPNVYFKPAEANRWKGLGSTAGITGSYVYRSLGTINGVMSNIPTGQNIPSSRSWDMSFYPKRALMIDGVSTIFNEGPVARFTHYNSTSYQGFNRMFFDGSANWMRDPNCAWRSYMPAGNTSYGNAYQNAWIVADTFGL